MSEQEREALLKEFREVRRKYGELLAKLVELGVPGAMRPVEAGCNVGEVCHGGSFVLPDLTIREEPARQAKR